MESLDELPWTRALIICPDCSVDMDGAENRRIAADNQPSVLMANGRSIDHDTRSFEGPNWTAVTKLLILNPFVCCAAHRNTNLTTCISWQLQTTSGRSFVLIYMSNLH
jgi:hypothetical protein